jgi:hypothetical protein
MDCILSNEDAGAGSFVSKGEYAGGTQGDYGSGDFSMQR